MVLEAVHCPCLWLEITAEIVMLLSPLALRAWALWRLLAWPLAASSSHIRPGGQVADAVGRLQPAGHCEGMQPRDLLLPLLQPSLLEQKGEALS